MSSNILKYVFLAVFAAPTLTPQPVVGQTTARARGNQLLRDCPSPTTQTMTMVTRNHYAPDWPATPVDLANINDTRNNRHFRHTFRWDPRRCPITSLVLTVNLKGIDGNMADDDTMGIVRNGASIPGTGRYLYPTFAMPPYSNNHIPVGFLSTQRVEITDSTILGLIDADGRLNFNVQDDTAVLSANLVINRCYGTLPPQSSGPQNQ